MTFPAPIFAAQSADLSLQKSCASPRRVFSKRQIYLSFTITVQPSGMGGLNCYFRAVSQADASARPFGKRREGQSFRPAFYTGRSKVIAPRRALLKSSKSSFDAFAVSGAPPFCRHPLARAICSIISILSRFSSIL